MTNAGAMKKVQKWWYGNSKEVAIWTGERIQSCWNLERRRWHFNGIGKMARNLKKMERKEEVNQKEKQEQSQKMPDLFRFAECRL